MTFNLPGLTLDFVPEVKGFNFDKKYKSIYFYLFIVGSFSLGFPGVRLHNIEVLQMYSTVISEITK